MHANLSMSMKMQSMCFVIVPLVHIWLLHNDCTILLHYFIWQVRLFPLNEVVLLRYRMTKMKAFMDKVVWSFLAVIEHIALAQLQVIRYLVPLYISTHQITAPAQVHPTSRKNFLSNNQIIRTRQLLAQLLVPKNIRPTSTNTRARATNKRAYTQTTRISPPSQKTAIKSIPQQAESGKGWQRLKTTSDRWQGQRQQFPRVEKQRETTSNIRERSQQPRVRTHISEWERALRQW